MRKTSIGGVGLLIVAMTQSVWATIVSFDDLTDAVTATVDGIQVTLAATFSPKLV
jgi:hypothetical protein